MAIYPNTPSDLIAEHVAYIKNREWLDVRIPVEYLCLAAMCCNPATSCHHYGTQRSTGCEILSSVCVYMQTVPRCERSF